MNEPQATLRHMDKHVDVSYCPGCFEAREAEWALAEAIAIGAKEAEEDAARLAEALRMLYRAPIEAHYEAAVTALRLHDERVKP